jgi:hypothetical protein
MAALSVKDLSTTADNISPPEQNSKADFALAHDKSRMEGKQLRRGKNSGI